MDSSNVTIGKDHLHDWVEKETRALDVVASWETLCDAYRTLEFSDPISDTIRMEEFKWIIAEMNKHLSRARKKLFGCQDPESMMKTLESMFVSTDAQISNRMNLTYHKLRQIWVLQMMATLEPMVNTEEEENQDGGNFWDE